MKRITNHHRASGIKRQVGIALVWLGIPRQESASGGVTPALHRTQCGASVILPIAYVKQSSGGIHETAEVAEGEITRAIRFKRIAPRRVTCRVGDFARGVSQLALGVCAVHETIRPGICFFADCAKSVKV